jgi:phosphotransferase system HPr (HPr) family protein
MIVEKQLIVKNKMGLHARPAAIFVQKANKFPCDIRVAKGDQEVNGKSIMGILMLAAEKGAEIKLIADGVSAEEAVQELADFLEQEQDPEFGE